MFLVLVSGQRPPG